MPADPNCDEETAAIRFGDGFAARFGRPSPRFFAGSLGDAVEISCHRPAKEVVGLILSLYIELEP